MLRSISLWSYIHFPQRAKSLTQTAFFSPENTDTHEHVVPYCRHRSWHVDRCHFFESGHFLTTWMRSGLKRQGLKCSSDSHFRCNTPLWSIWRRWSSLAFPELKFNSRHVSQLMPFLQGIKCLHTVCHWKLSIITGRHACLATTEKALILLLYFYCLFVFSYRTCLVNNCLSNWFCRIFVNTAV